MGCASVECAARMLILPLASVDWRRLEIADRPPNSCPATLHLRRGTSILHRSVDATRRIGERTTGQHRGVAIPIVGNDVLVEQRVVRERRQREPEIEITLRVCARRVQPPDARATQIRALTRYEELSIAADR